MSTIKLHIRSFWVMVSANGLNQDYSLNDKRRLALLNRLLVLSLLTFAFYAVLEASIGLHHMVPIQLTAFCVSLLTLGIIRLGYHHIPKYLFLCNCVATLVADSIATDGAGWVEVFFIPICAIPAIIFRTKLVSKLSVGAIVVILITLISNIDFEMDTHGDLGLEILRKVNLICSTLLVIIIVFYFRTSSRTFEETMKEKNAEISQRNQEINDSLAYASRLQNAVLPDLNYIQEYLPETFIYYQPKEQVSGDFYWFEEKDGYLNFAVADCTGHGVPGAMVSIVGHSGLYRSVNEYLLTCPGKILDRLSSIIVKSFTSENISVKDGMDIAFCSYSPDKQTLSFAGAHNSLWILRGNQLIEYKGDKQPIGFFSNRRSFETKVHQVQKGDKAIILSDGYVDQFGGPSNKKFKSKQLKEILKTNSTLQTQELGNLLVEKFQNWRGNEEQTDDVCLMIVEF